MSTLAYLESPDLHARIRTFLVTYKIPRLPQANNAVDNVNEGVKVNEVDKVNEVTNKSNKI